jgi:hypothetical protein
MSYDPTGGYYRPTQTPAPKPKRHVLAWVAGAALALCVLGTIVAAVTGRGDGKTPGPVASKAVQIAEGAASRAPAKGLPASPSAKPKPVTVGAGSWEVGTEVKPGTYTATAQDYCYWARLKAFDGDLNSIITNGNLDAGERGRITVKKSDKGLELSGDCTWKRAS